jgi:predicted TIM-barrel fold metal-dependent hydrolase
MEGEGYYPFQVPILDKAFRHTLNRNNWWLKRFKDSVRRKDGYFPGYLNEVKALEQRLLGFPSVTFIGHGPGIWEGLCGNREHQKVPWDPFIHGMLADHDNFYLDISGKTAFSLLKKNPETARKLLMAFGRKILYGTDNFILGQEQFIRSLQLPDPIFRDIMGRNADRLLLV